MNKIDGFSSSKEGKGDGPSHRLVDVHSKGVGMISVLTTKGQGTASVAV